MKTTILAILPMLFLGCIEPEKPLPSKPAPKKAEPVIKKTSELKSPSRLGQIRGGMSFIPNISISPTQAEVEPGGKVTFMASINYDPNGPQYIRQPVDFKVEEADGGKIDIRGFYEAPLKAGVYHVIAQRQDFPDKKARATVYVK